VSDLGLPPATGTSSSTKRPKSPFTWQRHPIPSTAAADCKARAEYLVIRRSNLITRDNVDQALDAFGTALEVSSPPQTSANISSAANHICKVPRALKASLPRLCIPLALRIQVYPLGLHGHSSAANVIWSSWNPRCEGGRPWWTSSLPSTRCSTPVGRMLSSSMTTHTHQLSPAAPSHPHCDPQ
jgi:hypothetical protein